jgi:3-deoxy-D-manno-octulosonic-acid transferase
MQSAEDARRIVAMGAPAAVLDAGNLKYDISPRLLAEDERRRLVAVFALPPQMPLLLAASTHSGEEEPILALWSRLRQQGRAFAAVMVPRHPERAPQVAEMARAAGWRVRLRSALGLQPEPLAADELLVVDTIGELTSLYSLASLAFVGGSLVPVGGHNILEPLAAGAATIFGPHMHNFRDISALVLAASAGMQVRDAAELEQVTDRLLGDEEALQQLVTAGVDLLRRTGGAVERHLDTIVSLLPDEH